jgi:dTDP-4-amino-4,6-dideoxygalactose transaminase
VTQTRGAVGIPLARPLIGDGERAAVDRVLRSGGLAQGPEVAAFEAEFAALVGGRTCVAVSSGTTALHLGMLAAGIGPGDEVIVPSFSFAASANAVRLCGATPVFADIRPDTFCLDPAAAATAVTARTAAIMAVHLYGQTAEVRALRDLAARHDLLLVEDAAQAHGAALDGVPAGAWGGLAAFSFYPTKNMTCGEGGMVVTDDDRVARQVRLLRNQGMEQRYRNEIVGFNARLTDLAAAIGRVQLRRLADWNTARRRNAADLDAGLAGVEGVVTPAVAPGATHAYHQYTVRADDRDALLAAVGERGVGCGVYYPTPIHRLPAYAEQHAGDDLPETDRAAAEVLSLPVRPDLTPAEVATVVDAVTGARAAGARTAVRA